MNSTESFKIGIVGGSGLYDLPGLSNITETTLQTPFGQPSDAYIEGRLNGANLVFLPRHGKGHRFLPSEVNYQANIFGFKLLGVTHLISVTAVGSLKEEIAPQDIVIPDQLIDRTVQRKSTFFGNGVAGHIPFAEPFCPELSTLLYETGVACKAAIHKTGTFVTIEGPAFSTKAESKLYQAWGIDIIGMTTLQEAKLSREAEICYAAMAMVTDYDCWKEDERPVTVDAVVEHMQQNSVMAKQIITDVIPRITADRKCLCPESLQNAVMTDPSAMDPDTVKALSPLISKYIA